MQNLYYTKLKSPISIMDILTSEYTGENGKVIPIESKNEVKRLAFQKAINHVRAEEFDYGKNELIKSVEPIEDVNKVISYGTQWLRVGKFKHFTIDTRLLYLEGDSYNEEEDNIGFEVALITYRNFKK